jgi:hypothetical protein
MIYVLLLAAASDLSPVKSKVGDWSVSCASNSPADDGLFDRCEMRRMVSGHNIKDVEFVAIRDSNGIVLTVSAPKCQNLQITPRVTIPAELLNQPDADKKLIGAQFLAMNSLARQCADARGIALNLGGAEIPELLNVTSKIRKRP